ncbi:uncharacterized protein LOC130648686 isoform X1 [Hydractinia symbiolongicarpus]|uniref:uncharacterized protein LOC130648686 isoform X1 n=1 Tax=Hydractinia symbiolongicarpus TaxID=13093 RepID=UPI00255080EB|nr:uncharacterized protein LOC130648686 isoform X1 [Hydractinia symbiolongicarpus]
MATLILDPEERLRELLQINKAWKESYDKLSEENQTLKNLLLASARECDRDRYSRPRKLLLSKHQILKQQERAIMLHSVPGLHIPGTFIATNVERDGIMQKM